MASPCLTGVHVAPGAASARRNRLLRLARSLRQCTLCAADFESLGHAPRPVARLSATARICVCGQAPGTHVHRSGLPFDDPSGKRLRDWMGVDRDQFYDARRIVTLPMAFCFPGQDGRGADLPPPKRCSEQWRERLLGAMPQLRLFLLVGYHAQRWHLGVRCRDSLTANVAAWEEFLPSGMIPLPHPSWRNNGWLKKNTWFEKELIPILKENIHTYL